MQPSARPPSWFVFGTQPDITIGCIAAPILFTKSLKPVFVFDFTAVCETRLAIF